MDFRPNYGGAFQEPQLLPARLPFVLLNASGIAVGMAHRAVQPLPGSGPLPFTIEHPPATVADLLRASSGPHPGGGQLISPAADIHAGPGKPARQPSCAPAESSGLARGDGGW